MRMRRSDVARVLDGEAVVRVLVALVVVPLLIDEALPEVEVAASLGLALVLDPVEAPDVAPGEVPSESVVRVRVRSTSPPDVLDVPLLGATLPVDGMQFVALLDAVVLELIVLVAADVVLRRPVVVVSAPTPFAPLVAFNPVKR